MSITGSFDVQHQTLLNITQLAAYRFIFKALAHYNRNYKKVAIAYTYYNFFFTTATVFQQCYIWAMIFAPIFLRKIAVKVFVVCEGL